MKNNLYVKQESRTKQYIFGAHIAGLGDQERGSGYGKDPVVFLQGNDSHQQAI